MGKDFTKRGNPAYKENASLAPETELNGLIDKNPVRESPRPAGDPEETTEDLLKNFVEPVKKTRSKRVQILVTPEMFSKIKATATAGNVSVNEVINQALAHFYS